jgi:hypothetical protein
MCSSAASFVVLLLQAVVHWASSRQAQEQRQAWPLLGPAASVGVCQRLWLLAPS